MPRVLIAEFIYEVSSFNPVPTRYGDFIIKRGEPFFESHRLTGCEVGGALQVLESTPGVEVIPTLGIRSPTCGGELPSADWRQLASEFLESVKKAPPVDAAYFALHGAIAATDEPDPEGYLLAEARKILGERMPIVASFDLHGILTDRILEHADAITIYHTYPHVDFFETGQRSARLLLRILNGEAKPVTARVFIPALVRGSELITETGVFGKVVGQAAVFENSPIGLSAGMFIGNPFTDVPELGSDSVVVANGDAELAKSEAIRLANEFWKDRERMQQPLTGLKESVRLASETRGTVILTDAADATSSGASGDSNAILREMVESGYGGKALIPIVDPPAVEAAWAVGVGHEVRTTVGGALDPRRFRPLPISARVRMLSDGCFRAESFNQEWNSGKTAVIQFGSITLVVTSRPVHLFDRSLFYAHGQDPKRFDAVVVKSPHCQRHMFADWCARLLNVDAPGATSANVRALGHTKCRRPIFPLDPEVQFVPEVKVFSRTRT